MFPLPPYRRPCWHQQRTSTMTFKVTVITALLRASPSNRRVYCNQVYSQLYRFQVPRYCNNFPLTASVMLSHSSTALAIFRFEGHWIGLYFIFFAILHAIVVGRVKIIWPLLISTKFQGSQLPSCKACSRLRQDDRLASVLPQNFSKITRFLLKNQETCFKIYEILNRLVVTTSGPIENWRYMLYIYELLLIEFTSYCTIVDLYFGLDQLPPIVAL